MWGAVGAMNQLPIAGGADTADRPKADVDMGGNDQTAQLAIAADLQGAGTIAARRAGTIAGTYLLPAIPLAYDAAWACHIQAPGDSRVTPGHEEPVGLRPPPAPPPRLPFPVFP